MEQILLEINRIRLEHDEREHDRAEQIEFIGKVRPLVEGLVADVKKHEKKKTEPITDLNPVTRKATAEDPLPQPSPEAGEKKYRDPSEVGISPHLAGDVQMKYLPQLSGADPEIPPPTERKPRPQVTLSKGRESEFELPDESKEWNGTVND